MFIGGLSWQTTQGKSFFFPTLALLKCHHVVRNPGVDHREPNQTYWKSCVCYGVCWDELSLFLFVVFFFSFEVANTLRMNAPIHIYHSGFL